MTTLLLGTHNKHKVKEISYLLENIPFKIQSLDDFPNLSPVEENGETLEQNAVLKAKTYAKLTGLLTVADDTGLEVAALNGEPGVKSARYAGENCSYEDNNRKLLRELAGLNSNQRTAKFRCVIACYDPNSNWLQLAEGVLSGEILPEMKGKNGFGYDPIFYVPSLGKTLAELTLEEKNTISHRALALKQAKKILEAISNR